MDSKTIQHICSHNVLLKSCFLGIIRFKDLETLRLKNVKVQCGDFFIVNIRNLYWIALMWGKEAKQLFVFDSLSAKSLSLNKNLLRKIIFRNFNIKAIVFQYGKGRLQNFDSLTCGEHVIYWCMYQNLFYKNHGYFDTCYVHKVVMYCKRHCLTVDFFIWNAIYNNLRLALPPNLDTLLHYVDV